MKLSVVILAAGAGKRMHSNIPKTLHKLAEKPLLEHVVNVAQQLNPNNIYVVYGNHGGEQLVEQLSHLQVTWVQQPEPLGTGHAVMQVLPMLNKQHNVLVLCGDVPLISIKTLERLIKQTSQDAIGWLTSLVEEPTGLGRILRDEGGNPKAIIEERDATIKQKEIREVNAGVCCIPVKYLTKWLPKIKNDNSQKEYYLTDMFKIALANHVGIITTHPRYSYEILGVNDCSQLAHLERIYQLNQANKYMVDGLMIRDPNRFDIRGNLVFGKDVVMDVNVIIEGDVKIGNNCHIGSNVLLRNVEIADNVNIAANTVIDSATIEEGCLLGPFSRIRPETRLKAKSKIGNFVEVKKSEIGVNSKVNHLSYIGDTTVGKNVNIGAGTITCNYDGVNKYKTVIEDNVFVGSSTQLVAPLTVGENATIGAGSTITADVPSNELTLARTKQVTIQGWERPKKKERNNNEV